MKLKRLLRNFPDLIVKGSKEVEITGLCNHSKMVAPGNLFVAKKGSVADGAHFIQEAIDAGASVILTDLYNPFLNLVQILHPDVAEMEACLAAEYYQFPSQNLSVIGITGTNGKTTCSYLIKQLLETNGISAGLIGTVEWIIGPNHFSPTLTTPDVITTQKLLGDMVGQKCQAAVMEVSSHALDQNRVQQILFKRALFTNLTQDHLDYHLTMEKYAEAKQRLFSSLEGDAVAILNRDDPRFFFMQEGCPVKTISYGMDSGADVYATEIKLSEKGSNSIVHANGQSLPMTTLLIGKFNVYNLLSAISLGLSFSISLEKCIASLQSFKGARGRLQKVKNSLGLNIFVDYAHTDDALKNVLLTLGELKRGKLITVFGCGGNRDRAKRKKMGHVQKLFPILPLSQMIILEMKIPLKLQKRFWKALLIRGALLSN